jgi:hypothetical protein
MIAYGLPCSSWLWRSPRSEAAPGDGGWPRARETWSRRTWACIGYHSLDRRPSEWHITPVHDLLEICATAMNHIHASICPLYARFR